MNATNRVRCPGWMRSRVVWCAFVIGLLVHPGPLSAEEQAAPPVQPGTGALEPGEVLTYDISWSRVVTAGTAIMEIKEGTLPDGKRVLRLIATTHSEGMVDTFYPVKDRLESVFDRELMQSLSFSLNQSHGKKKSRRELVFDPLSKTVTGKMNDNAPETLTVPDQTQDALSSLYYLRTREDFVVGKPIILHVYDGGKNWSVEVQTLGREKVKTPAGEFSTIKVRTFPTYEGVFMNKGEIFMWLTDDKRKVPVLMKSTISIGSIVSTLTNIEPRGR